MTAGEDRPSACLLSNKLCYHCKSSEAAFLCSRCRRVRFCSTDCQRQAWLDHKVDCASSSSSSALIRPTAQTNEGDWVGLIGMDAFPGDDVIQLRVGLDEAKRECLRHCCNAFVYWNGTAYLRRQSATDLVKALQPAVGATLWIASASLASLDEKTSWLLPELLPEVKVEGSRQVQKCSRLSEQQMTEFFRKSIPVVLKDAQVDWQAREKWTFQWFSERFGKEEMICSDLAPFFKHCDRGKIRTVKTSMKEFMSYMMGKPNALKALQMQDRVFYANGWAPFLQHEDLLKDVSDRLYCVQDSIPRGDGPTQVFNDSLTKVFMGPAGTISRLHRDTYATHVWLSQVRGRKQFICYPPEDSELLHAHDADECDGRTTLYDPSSPDFDKYPSARRAQAFSVVVEEGETVVLPSRWWHWAKSLSPSVTLMRNFVNETNLKDYVEIRKRQELSKSSSA